MRIVSWNCCRGPLARKLAALDGLSPDIAVLSEATLPAQEADQVLWFPAAGSSLGIQVVARGDYKIARLPAADLPNCVVPVRVTGPYSFNLLAVWTWPAPTYLKAFMNGLAAYAELIRGGDAVVAGDFNGNPKFDKPGARIKWSDAFSALQDAGMVSAYHRSHAVPYGAELDATHHFRREASRPFHIDFCFVPQSWTKQRWDAEVVSSPEWSLLSDHFPLVVTIDV